MPTCTMTLCTTCHNCRFEQVAQVSVVPLLQLQRKEAMMSSDVSLHVGASRLQSIAKIQQSIAYINPNDGMEVTFQVGYCI
jgi:hypothetical protein